VGDTLSSLRVLSLFFFQYSTGAVSLLRLTRGWIRKKRAVQRVSGGTYCNARGSKECAALKTLTQRESSQQPTTALLKLNTLEEIRTRVIKWLFKITFEAFYKFFTQEFNKFGYILEEKKMG
jgi:hypothetical protein